MRAATIALFAGFDEAPSRRAGIGNDNAVSVRGIVWVVAGHERHHVGILRERYGLMS